MGALSDSVVYEDIKVNDLPLMFKEIEERIGSVPILRGGQETDELFTPYIYENGEFDWFLSIPFSCIKSAVILKETRVSNFVKVELELVDGEKLIAYVLPGVIEYIKELNRKYDNGEKKREECRPLKIKVRDLAKDRFRFSFNEFWRAFRNSYKYVKLEDDGVLEKRRRSYQKGEKIGEIIGAFLIVFSGLGFGIIILAFAFLSKVSEYVKLPVFFGAVILLYLIFSMRMKSKEREVAAPALFYSQFQKYGIYPIYKVEDGDKIMKYEKWIEGTDFNMGQFKGKMMIKAIGNAYQIVARKINKELNDIRA